MCSEKYQIYHLDIKTVKDSLTSFFHITQVHEKCVDTGAIRTVTLLMQGNSCRSGRMKDVSLSFYVTCHSSHSSIQNLVNIIVMGFVPEEWKGKQKVETDSSQKGDTNSGT